MILLEVLDAQGGLGDVRLEELVRQYSGQKASPHEPPVQSKVSLVEGNRYAHRWQKLFRLKLRALRLLLSFICGVRSPMSRLKRA